jgi:hypothetical protein
VSPLFENGIPYPPPAAARESLLIARHMEQVNAIEIANPPHVATVKTILICHSMGGIVAVDSILSMSFDKDPLTSTILGILAYDTPYFGLNPPVIHRTISTRVNTISNAYNTAKDWIPASLLASKSTAVATSQGQKKATWGLGKTMAAVTAGVAAVGAMTYFAKDPVVNHLQFVSVLYKPEELARRMRKLNDINNMGFVCFYTVMREQGEERTFCLLPEKRDGRWIRQENGLAKDEVEAHCGMFLKAANEHYEEMCIRSLGIIREWIHGDRTAY